MQILLDLPDKSFVAFSTFPYFFFLASEYFVWAEYFFTRFIAFFLHVVSQ